MLNIKSLMLIALVAATTLTPVRSSAGDDKLWWGLGGLAVGSVAGYAVGHETGSWNRQPAYYAQPSYCGPTTYYQDGLPVMTGQSYYKETRVWPFYRRVENYPIASTSARLGRSQAVSMADGPRWVESGSPEDNAQPIQVDIGDNNSNINITVGGKAQDTSKEATEIVPVVNGTDAAGKRVVNTPMTASKAREYRQEVERRNAEAEKAAEKAPATTEAPKAPKATTTAPEPADDTK